MSTRRSSSHTRALLARLLLRWLLTRDLPSHTRASLAELRGERTAWHELECADGLAWYNADRRTTQPVSLRRPKMALTTVAGVTIAQLGNALVTMSPTTRRTTVCASSGSSCVALKSSACKVVTAAGSERGHRRSCATSVQRLNSST